MIKAKYIQYFRINDWLFSFIPFLIGLNYLWVLWFEVNFSVDLIFDIVKSNTLLIGLAMLGYLINEYFDIKSDLLAGKKNVLSQLNSVRIALIFTIPLSILFALLLCLPFNRYTLFYIGIETFLFLFYSIPVIRLKENWYTAGVIDSLYAYVIPILLSFNMFLLYTDNMFQYEIIILCIGFFFCGYRNILLHQIKDITFDKRSDIVSLPIKLGKRKTKKILTNTFVFEILICSLSFCFLVIYNKSILVFLFSYLFYIGIKYVVWFYNFKGNTSSFLYLFPNKFYQVYAPLIILIILSFYDLRWLIVYCFHFIFFVSSNTKKTLFDFTRNIVSIAINYSIYYFFILFGVNLQKEKKSAFEYLKSKCKCVESQE